ncbi:MAG TPA: YraN family protein [Actinomycetota bacterium]|nr:YraN family protein [Actinomycetota bacterium]
MDARVGLGRSGEDLAASLYRDLGFRIVDRNCRVGRGEIDLIAVKDRLLVFCEVKTRRTNRWGEPSEAVGYAKQARLRRLAAGWMRRHRPGPVEVRFDVVSVIVGERDTWVTHLPEAF